MGKISVLIKTFLTKVTIFHISHIILFRISKYWPIWVELCTVFFFCVFPFLIVIRRPSCCIQESVSSYMNQFLTMSDTSFGKYSALSRYIILRMFCHKAGNSSVTVLCSRNLLMTAEVGGTKLVRTRQHCCTC